MELDDERRLRRIEALALLDGTEDDGFTRATRLASALMEAPVSLVSIVTADAQVFPGLVGLPEPWASDRRTPLSHSFCQHVVLTEAPLVVTDAREHALVKDNLAIRDLDVIAYVGVPLRSSDGQVLGSFCAIDSDPREWTERELALLTDLAELVHLQIQLREAATALDDALTERDNVLAGISHDVAQPLTSIEMAAETLVSHGDRLTPERRAEVLDTIGRQAARATSLVRELTGLDDAEVAVDVDVAAVVGEVESGIVQHGLGGRFRVEGVDPAPAWRGDPAVLYRIVANLVRNAFVHAGSGTHVVVTVAATDEGIRVDVADDGVGIAPEDQERIFRLRQQGRAAREGSGQGLGLHIARLLARDHGGDLTVESTPGEGSTFTVMLADR